ncbi:MAG: M1 family metallopeptidase [Gemmatimonadota bacterium]
MRTPIVSLLLAAFASHALSAQQPTQPPAQPSAAFRSPVADTGIFSPLPLPDPTEVRSANGAPGPRYWQQRADYAIVATLDTTARTLKGTVTIRYTNNSPDSLPYLWLQMDQNLFRPGSTGSMLNAASSRFGGAGFQGGFEIENIYQTAAARPATGANRPRAVAAAQLPVKTRVDDTMMRVDLAAALAPGQATVLVIAYHFNIPEHGADRMGRDGNLYELAQWYPRMAVYDDQLGWNTDQYLGQGEFYLEYGDYAYEVTVPAGFILAGTGTLQNPLEVLTAAQRSRLAQAAHSDTTIHIVTEADLASGAARPKASGMLTWKFKAQNVRDVAWAAAPNYLWDASGWEDVLAQAYYRPAAKATWSDAAKESRFSIKEYSDHWFRYPYPQISAVEGTVSGMEYPMLAMEANASTLKELYNVVTHEIGHNWFPMIVGSNERRYAWMDEGFNTFVNTFSEENYFSRNDSLDRKGETGFVLQNDQSVTAQPMITGANRYKTDPNLGSLAYVKPSIMLLALRNKVLGPEVFDAAFREYIKRWAFKHPLPSDFIRTMNNAAGRDLSWFWRGWIYTTATIDQSIENVTQRSQGSNNIARIVLRNPGQMVMPVELTLTMKDGTTQLIRLPVEIWYRGDRFTYTVTTTQPIASAKINADGFTPDVNPANNEWKAAP